MATLLGNPVRLLLFQIEDADLFSRVEVNWILSLITGIALLALILLWLGLYPGLLIPSLTWILSLVSLTVNVMIYRKQLLRWRGYLRRPHGLPKFKARWFIALFLLIMAVQMSPLAGLWVTPGDDAKLYSLISIRVVESQGIPKDWGIFASSTWYNEHTHLLLPGFSSEVAFLDILFATGIPSAVSVIASLFRLLTSASLYAFVWTLTRRRMPSTLAMAAYGLVIVEPAFGWFTWGGMAELAGISILPIAIAGTYLVSKQHSIPWGLILWTAILISGFTFLHPFVFFYYVGFLAALSIVMFLRRHAARALVVWLPVLLSVVIGSGPLLNALSPEISFSQTYTAPNPGWTPVLNSSLSIPQGVWSLVLRFVTVYGLALTIIFLVGVVASIRFLRREAVFGILGLWYLFLFLLHENNPNGLFLIPFPLWYRIDSNRTFGITSLIVVVVVALVGEYWVRRSLRAWPPAHAASIPKLHKLIKSNWRSILVSGILLILVISQVIANTSLLFGAQSDSPVSYDDIIAFNWIRTQTPVNATFFVNLADAGSWIPVYAERRVVMPFGVITNNSLLENYTALVSSFAKNASSQQDLQSMKSLGVSYVYAGPTRIYGRMGFDPTSIIATRLFTVEFHRGDVWVFHIG